MDTHPVLETATLFSTFLVITPAANIILLFVIVILLLLSFFVAGSEVAYFSLTAKDINVLKTRRQPSFRRIVNLLEQPKILLASMLIANSFVNIGIILISNLLLNEWLDGYNLPGYVNFLIKVVSVTLLLVLFAEVLPKVWATHHKVWFAATASLVIEIFNSLFYRLSKRMVRFSDNIEKKGFSDKFIIDGQ